MWDVRDVGHDYQVRYTCPLARLRAIPPFTPTKYGAANINILGSPGWGVEPSRLDSTMIFPP